MSSELNNIFDCINCGLNISHVVVHCDKTEALLHLKTRSEHKTRNKTLIYAWFICRNCIKKNELTRKKWVFSRFAQRSLTTLWHFVNLARRVAFWVIFYKYEAISSLHLYVFSSSLLVESCIRGNSGLDSLTWSASKNESGCHAIMVELTGRRSWQVQHSPHSEAVNASGFP